MFMNFPNSKDIRRRLMFPPNNAINSDVRKRRFALLLHAGCGER